MPQRRYSTGQDEIIPVGITIAFALGDIHNQGQKFLSPDLADLGASGPARLALFPVRWIASRLLPVDHGGHSRNIAIYPSRYYDIRRVKVSMRENDKHIVG